MISVEWGEDDPGVGDVVVDRGGGGGSDHGRHPTVFRRGEPRRSRSPRLRRGDPSPTGARRGWPPGGRCRPRRGSLHRETGDAPLDELHPGVVEEVLDVLAPAGGEVIDDGDVVVLSEGVCKV